jgi:hypothetical protein
MKKTRPEEVHIRLGVKLEKKLSKEVDSFINKILTERKKVAIYRNTVLKIQGKQESFKKAYEIEMIMSA